MTELEFAILIIVVLLIVFVLYGHYKKYRYMCESRVQSCPSLRRMPTCGMAAMTAAPPKDVGYDGDYQEYTKKLGLDDSTIASHREYVKDATLAPVTATRLVVTDHDLNSNWRGLFRPQRVAVSADATYQDTNDVLEYAPGTKRWLSPEAEY